MPLTQRQEIVQVRRAEVFPPRDVMDPAVLEPHLTAGEPTGPVHRPQSPTLLGCGETTGPPQVQRDPVIVHDDRGDGGVTPQAADGLDREWLAVTGLTHRVLMGTLTHRAGIGEQRQIRDAVPGGAGPGDQPDQRVSLQVIELDVVALRCSTRS